MYCGDYRQGIARIRCSNPDCGHDYFRPFSCKGFYLCPSCSQKRILLFAENMNEEVLLRLFHRQFVFTFPKALRVFFRHDRRLFAEILKMIFAMISDFYREVAGKEIDTIKALAFQKSMIFETACRSLFRLLSLEVLSPGEPWGNFNCNFPEDWVV
jgi:hypothetical protein